MKHIMGLLRRALLRAAFDRQGSMATFIAASIVPLVAFGGLAVDTAQGYLLKTRLQYAQHAAALAGGRSMFDEMERDAAINRIFKANLPGNYMNAAIVGPIISRNTENQTVKVEASATQGTSLMSVLGLDNMSIAAATEVQRQVKGMELALVLDITGSMRCTPGESCPSVGGSDSKLHDLKHAAARLVDIMYAGRDEIEHFYISIVPYTGTINVGQQHADWLRTGGGSYGGGYGSHDDDPVWGYDPSDYSPVAWKGCVEARHRFGRDRNDDPPSAEKFYPHYWPSDITYQTSKYDTLEDREWRSNPWRWNNIDETNECWGLGPNLNCGDPIVPLTRTRITIDQKISELKYWRFGGTKGNQGLVWGWRTISPR